MAEWGCGNGKLEFSNGKLRCGNGKFESVI